MKSVDALRLILFSNFCLNIADNPDHMLKNKDVTWEKDITSFTIR